ncbi:hypothetical protein ACFLV1_00270 [Chloroflexota bacterium]
MKGEWLTRLIQAAMITLTTAAILQELEKPEEEREWHGTIAKFVPYDFRIPTLEKLNSTFWNPYTDRTFMPTAFGVGWGINFYTLLEKFRIMSQDLATEEEFLMPTKTIKEILTQQTK